MAGEGTWQVMKGAGLNMRLGYAIVMKGGGHQAQRRSLRSWMIAINWQLSHVTDWALGGSTAEFFLHKLMQRAVTLTEFKISKWCDVEWIILFGNPP